MGDNRILSEQGLRKLFSDFEKKLLPLYTEEETAEILRAARWAHRVHEGQKRASGEPYIIHPLKTAEILMEIHMDARTIMASLLHDVLEDTSMNLEDLANEFGGEVSMLVDGVTKITLDHVQNKDLQKVETLRKMVLAMVKDIRVIFIKLADKRHNMNTLEYMSPEKQKRISQECLEIFAPLAGKLGMNTLRSELEDLSLKYLHPETWERIRSFVDHKREARAVYLDRASSAIRERAAEHGLTCEVRTRAKHYYSIYRKLKDKGKSLEEVYDILGVRVLCETKNDCYAMLGVIHQLWPPLEGRFKDYIAMPKENNYQSLHTSVLCFEGRSLEVQIRTFEMNEIAEYGMAAHLVYKEHKSPEYADPMNWQLVDKLRVLHDQGYNSSDFLDTLKREILEDTLVVYTPKGDPILLPRGSTAIDFAYHIHTDVGNHCAGARADGAIIPLNRPLRNTQTVQILTSPKAQPHIKWLKAVKTSSARSKIKYWLTKNDPSVIIGKNVVAIRKEESVPKKIRRREGWLKGEQGDTETILDQSRSRITIDKERNMMIRMARCCNPVHGDRIIGYISRGRGIIVHKAGCPNLKGMEDFEARKIRVDWESSEDRFTRSFEVHSRYTPDLFSEIANAIRKQGGHLIAGSLQETERGELSGLFTVETVQEEAFRKITRHIRMIPSVIRFSRAHQVADGEDYE